MPTLSYTLNSAQRLATTILVIFSKVSQILPIDFESYY